VTVKIGASLPNFAATGGPDVVRLARHAEDVGLESVFVGDHLVARGPHLDSTVVLTAAAAATTRLRVGFGVMIAALRRPAWIAKQVATMQLISGDRVLLGIGLGGPVHGDAGWRAAGVPWSERAARTDALLADLPALVRGETVDGIALAPGATVPPILIGGGSDAALRRTARFGDEWYAAFTPHDRIPEAKDRLAELAAGYGRPAPGITLGVSIALGDVPREAVDRHVRETTAYGFTEDQVRGIVITGSPAQAAERFAALAEAGVDRICARPFAGDTAEQYALVADAAGLLAPT
jgi:alkanesulfonate monooxygenase SsuD/methylene tetrahydromethanopterin reductase-like flavin-dependent oxidoreductase (luciferase family)